MLRIFIGIFLLSSCSLGVLKSGGQRSYVYDVDKDYSVEDLGELSSQVVTTFERDPQKGKLKDLFSKKQKPLKRIGIFIFETSLQPTRSGLSGEDKVYLSVQGKQLLTEKLLSMWEESLPILGPDFDYVPTEALKKSTSFLKYGSEVEDFIKSDRNAVAPDDIFYLSRGKRTPAVTVLNPRGMRDFSLVLVPATELMQGPKFSEHAKHALNDVARELKLDAALIVMSKVSWSASHIDKHSGEIIPEEISLKIEASTLISLSEYHQRLKKIKMKRDHPNTTVAYRAYEGAVKVPTLLSVPEGSQDFETIEEELLNPMLKAYKDLSQMTLMRMLGDMRLTH